MTGESPNSPVADQLGKSGAWAGYLVFGMFLLLLIVMDTADVLSHDWLAVAGVSTFALLFVLVPTGAWKPLRRALGQSGWSRMRRQRS